MMDDDAKKDALPSSASVSSETIGGSSGSDLKSMSLTELNTLLTEVLEQEDYIRAISIRDEIKSREK